VRVVFGAQYYFEYPDKNEYIIIFSNRGNEHIIEEFMSKKENSSYSMVNVHVSAYWV